MGRCSPFHVARLGGALLTGGRGGAVRGPSLALSVVPRRAIGRATAEGQRRASGGPAGASGGPDQGRVGQGMARAGPSGEGQGMAR